MTSKSILSATLSCSLLFLLAIQGHAQAPASSATTVKPAAASDRTVIAGIPVNYDESLVGTYTLPDPLILQNGKPVKNARIWSKKRRPEIVRLFEENQFGKWPDNSKANVTFNVFDKGTPALNGTALRKQVTIYFSKDTAGPHKMDLLIYTPINAQGPVPILLNIGFGANSVRGETGIKAGTSWDMKTGKKIPAQTSPFGGANPTPYLEAGFGYATFNYTDVDPDALGGAVMGVRSLFLKPGKTEPECGEWGSISAWAYGISCAIDYMETDKNIDATKVAITGTSRLGKTVLWAGAYDQRIAAVLACCSGEGGGALSRRNYGETVAHLTEGTRYPYQFTATYGDYGKDVSKLPVDAHMLVALIAPRAVLLSTGNSDNWSDPKGEFLAAVAAGKVFKLLGKDDLGTDVMPQAGQPILHTLSFYMHPGGHGSFDQKVFIDFMKLNLLAK